MRLLGHLPSIPHYTFLVLSLVHQFLGLAELLGYQAEHTLKTNYILRVTGYCQSNMGIACDKIKGNGEGVLMTVLKLWYCKNRNIQYYK